jgi:hypothetical protein
VIFEYHLQLEWDAIRVGRWSFLYFEFVSKVATRPKDMVVIFLTLNLFCCRLNDNVVDVSY